jgi:hypothetical protein
METNGNQKLQKSCKKYCCNLCNYVTSRKSSYSKHLLTSKHQEVAFGNKMETKSCKKLQNEEKYSCEFCFKEFLNRSGLWKHNTKCVAPPENKPEVNFDKDLMLILINQNKELLEIVKNGTMNNSNNTTNSHNKAFNLNFFLNETCKNAMNITDFVDSIKLQLSDLIQVGELGYVEGISKIIVKNLNNLDENIRPIHCTDKKRETFYVKDQDHWEKEDEDKKKIKRVIKIVANKNIRILPEFREKYPDYNNSSLKISDTYDKMVIEAMVSDLEKDEKIIRNISKVSLINDK